MGNDVVVALTDIILQSDSREIVILLNEIVRDSVQISVIHPNRADSTCYAVILKRITRDQISQAPHIDRDPFKAVIETPVIENAPIPVMILSDADAFISYGETAPDLIEFTITG